MRKILFICLLFVLLTSCESKPFTGYIVAKEYIAGHMCHDNNYEHTVEEAYVHVPVRPIHVHHHTWQEPEFILHVANKDEVRHIHVDSTDFYEYKLLEKVTFN